MNVAFLNSPGVSSLCLTCSAFPIYGACVTPWFLFPTLREAIHLGNSVEASPLVCWLECLRRIFSALARRRPVLLGPRWRTCPLPSRVQYWGETYPWPVANPRENTVQLQYLRGADYWREGRGRRWRGSSLSSSAKYEGLVLSSGFLQSITGLNPGREGATFLLILYFSSKYSGLNHHCIIN